MTAERKENGWLMRSTVIDRRYSLHRRPAVDGYQPS